MKKAIIALLCLCLFCGAAQAESSITPITDIGPYAGVWMCVGANDWEPYIVLHTDGTMEIYSWWQHDNKAELGAVVQSGSYTFDPAASTFMLPGDETVYKAQRVIEDFDTQTSDGNIDVPAGTELLVFEAPPEEDFDLTLSYVRLEDGFALLPTNEDLLSGTDGWYVVGDDGEETRGLWMFGADGKLTMTEGKVQTEGTYVLDNGQLKVTADGKTRVLFVQFFNQTFEEMSDEEFDLYSDILDEHPEWECYIDEGVLCVYEELDEGSSVGTFQLQKSVG